MLYNGLDWKILICTLPKRIIWVIWLRWFYIEGEVYIHCKIIFNGETNEAGLYSFDDLTAPKVILNHTFVPSAAVVGAGANIDVELSELIPGINVNVVASNENLGLFVGQPGAPVITSQVVTVQGVSLRTGVEASYTGSAGGSSGTGLVYSLSLNNDATFGNLREQTYERILTYSFSAL